MHGQQYIKNCLYRVFPHYKYLINGTIFGKTLLTKRVLIFSTTAV